MYKLIKKYEHLSLARKISFSSIILLLSVMLSFTVIMRIFFERSVVDIARDGYTGKFEAVSKNCLDLFSGAEQLSKIICTDENVQKWFDWTEENGNAEYVKRILRAERQLDYIDALYPQNRFSSISIFTANGDMLNTNNIRNQKEVYQKFFQTFEGQTVAVKWIDLSTLNVEGYEGNGIAFVRPYREYETGMVRGYIMVEYNEQILENNFAELCYGTQGQYNIVDDLGVIKISSNDTSGENVSNEEFYRYACDNDKGSAMFTIEGHKYLITCAKIEKINWIMVGLIPVDALTRKGSIMIRLIYLVGAIAILISAIFNDVIAHSVTKPLSKLAGLMERVGQGELNISVPILADDEVGTLSKNFNRMTIEINQLIQQVCDEQKAKRKYEISILQAQINPHFLYNTLNSVCSLIKMQKQDDAYAMICDIGQFYRTALSDGNILIPIEDEICNINSYIQIQSIRYGTKIRYDIQIDDEIKKYFILKLTLQPLIENAIYHGIKELERTGNITIRGYKTDVAIFFSIKDDGKGMNTNAVEELLTENEYRKNSFGLFSINKRIKLYFGNEYGIEIKSEEDMGFEVLVKIPFILRGEV